MDPLAPAGFDVLRMEALIDSLEMNEALDESSRLAVARGVFGSPAFFVGNEMFFGNARFNFVREALEQQT